MSETPDSPHRLIEDDPEHQRRIRERAHRIWEEEGCPPGRADAHWEMARELVAIEDNQRLATLPNPARPHLRNEDELQTDGRPIEPREALDNQGEFPGMADQGDESPRLRRRNTAENETG